MPGAAGLPIFVTHSCGDGHVLRDAPEWPPDVARKSDRGGMLPLRLPPACWLRDWPDCILTRITLLVGAMKMLAGQDARVNARDRGRYFQ